MRLEAKVQDAIFQWTLIYNPLLFNEMRKQLNDINEKRLLNSQKSNHSESQLTIRVRMKKNN